MKIPIVCFHIDHACWIEVLIIFVIFGVTHDNSLGSWKEEQLTWILIPHTRILHTYEGGETSRAMEVVRRKLKRKGN